MLYIHIYAERTKKPDSQARTLQRAMSLAEMQGASALSLAWAGAGLGPAGLGWF